MTRIRLALLLSLVALVFSVTPAFAVGNSSVSITPSSQSTRTCAWATWTAAYTVPAETDSVYIEFQYGDGYVSGVQTHGSGTYHFSRMFSAGWHYQNFIVIDYSRIINGAYMRMVATAQTYSYSYGC